MCASDGICGGLRVLAVVHVYYPRMWGELAACIRNLGKVDAVVTFVDEAAVAEARRDLPNATFIRCDNRGYDVWPFMQALAAVNLGDYDLVVKLHTKRDVEFPYRIVIGDTWLNGPNWRNHLLAFVRTPEAWRKTLARFRQRGVGMVADRHVIYGLGDALTDAHRNSFLKAAETLGREWGLPVGRRARFVGGTMFAARAEALRPFVAHRFTADMFAASAGHENETFAHVMERMLGLAMYGQGLRVVAFNGSVTCRRIGHALLRFLCRNRSTERWHTIRVCGIRVYKRRLDR